MSHIRIELLSTDPATAHETEIHWFSVDAVTYGLCPGLTGEAALDGVADPVGWTDAEGMPLPEGVLTEPDKREMLRLLGRTDAEHADEVKRAVEADVSDAVQDIEGANDGPWPGHAFHSLGCAIKQLEDARDKLDAAAGGELSNAEAVEDRGAAVEVSSLGEMVSFMGDMMQGGAPAAQAMHRHMTAKWDRELGKDDGADGDDGDDGAD